MTGRIRSAGRPTLDEVAARAGVGRGTVSRVINGSPQVSPRTKAVVERAVAELGYVPNRAARALVTQRTDSVALIVSESEERLFGEPFFAGIVRGVSAGLADTSLQLWLAMAQSPVERQRVVRHLTWQHVDGVLLLSLHDDDPLPAVLAERGLPTVLGGRPARMLTGGPQLGGYVDVDNSGGARLAVAHLRALGRRRIATIAGPQDMGVGVARLEGYRAGLGCSASAGPRAGQAGPASAGSRAGFGDAASAGSRAGAELVAYGDFSEASGATAMRSLLAAAPDLDAVFAASDLMAAGALRVLRTAGRRVPEDVAVVGFEDSPVARQTDPPLTTVHQPVEEMGRQMALLLTAMIHGEPAIPPPSVLLTTHLVIRGSASSR